MITFCHLSFRARPAGTGRAFAALAVAMLGVLAAPHAGARLLVVDSGSNSVQLYSAKTGALIDRMVPNGSGGLQQPRSLTLGPDGNLYVSDKTGILRYNEQTGAFLDTFIPAGTGGLDSPTGLTFGPDGDLYVVSQGVGSVLHFDGHTGAFLAVFVPNESGGLTSPYGLTFGPDDNLYVSSFDTSTVFRYDGSTGAFLDTFVTEGNGGLDGATDLVFGPFGILYVSSFNNNSVLRYNGDTGEFIDAFVPAGNGGLAQPAGLTFAPDGNLYVASQGTHSILRYNGYSGQFVDSFIADGSGAWTPRSLLFTLDAPSALTASPASQSQINLSWTDNSDDETAFAIWRKGGTTPWTRVGVVLPNVTAFADTTVSPNTSYTYKVRAISYVMASSWSNQVSATSFEAPPAAPFSLTARALSVTRISLSWVDNSDNETAISVWRKSGSGGFVRIAVLPARSTSFTDSRLNPGFNYTYRVRATNDNYASDWSNEASAKTFSVPPPVAPTSLVASMLSRSQIHLTWADHSRNETAYSVWRKSGSGGFVRIAVLVARSTRFTDSGLDPNTTYTYRVRATNDYFASDWTNQASATTAP